MTTPTSRVSARDRLLATAGDLFYAHGIHAVGIDRVIAESGVAKSTMYVHFRTKEQLVAGYLRRMSEVWRQQVETSVAAAEPPVLGVFDALDGFINTPQFRGCPWINAAAEYPDDADVRAAINEYRTWLYAILTTHGGDKAATLLALYDGAMIAGHLDGTHIAAQTARKAAAILLQQETR